MTITLCLIFLIFIGYREFFIYNERQKLLDRIQANTYVEYKKFEEKPEKKEIEQKSKKINWL